jgi:cytochrome subunit of sulfide dehydrogenase
MRDTIKVLGLAILLLSVGAANANSKANMLSDTCVVCHGDKGASLGPAIPNLAGMSRNYLVGAMLAFKYDDNQLRDIIQSDKDFEDVEAFSRESTVMDRIAKGYTNDEIKIIADYFSAQKLFIGQQDVVLSRVKTGKQLHQKYCMSCHEDEGKSSDGDTGVLAGQWKPYFLWTMSDYLNGSRQMPKKMKNKLKKMIATSGTESLQQLSDYYASITP